MQPTVPDVKPAESSPAPTFEPPKESQAYNDWRMTGKLPESAPAEKPVEQPKSEEPAPSKETAPDASGDKPQEQPHRKGKDAEARLQSILSDLREAGLSPAQLKTFKQDWQRQQAAETAAPPAKPEPTAKPQGSEAPAKPKMADFETYEAYEEARDQWVEQMADFKAEQRLKQFTQEQAAAAERQAIKARVDEAKARYGDEAEQTIAQTARALWNDQAIPEMVKSFLGDSPALLDVLYALGSQPDELAAFVELARTNPGAAVRKAVALEGQLPPQGEAKAGKPAPQRDADGRFVPAAAAKTPAEKKPTDAPPPPARELSTRGSTPPDEIESAVASGDFRTYMAAKNRRDLEQRRGR